MPKRSQLLCWLKLALALRQDCGEHGTLMERHPRRVDIPVTKPLGESYLDRDSQLEAAVNELLKQLGSRR